MSHHHLRPPFIFNAHLISLGSLLGKKIFPPMIFFLVIFNPQKVCPSCKKQVPASVRAVQLVVVLPDLSSCPQIGWRRKGPVLPVCYLFGHGRARTCSVTRKDPMCLLQQHYRPTERLSQFVLIVVALYIGLCTQG